MNTAAAIAKFTPDDEGEERALRRLPVEADVRCLEVVGQEVWTGDRSGKIVIRKVRTGDVVTEIRRPRPSAQGNVWCIRLVRLLADNAAGHVWTGLSTGAIMMYDSATKNAVNQVNRHTGGVYQIADLNGRVYSCGGDCKVIEWRADTHEVVRQFHGHKANVRCVMPLGGTLLSGSEDADIRIWDLATGRSVHTVQHHDKGIHAIAKAGNHIWSAGGSVIKVWDLHTLGLIASVAHHDATVLALTRVGARMYSCSADKTVIAWDLHTHQQVGSFHQHTGWVYALVNVAKAVRYFMWSTSINDGCVQVWSHDEYHAMDTVAKDTDYSIADKCAHNPEAALAEQLQDAVSALKARVKFLEGEVDSYQGRTRMLEDELNEQNQALERQLLINQQLAASLHQAKAEIIPGLEKEVTKHKGDVKQHATNTEVKTAEVSTLRGTLTTKDLSIKDLEAKLAASEAEKKKITAAYEAHKEAHIKYISCDVDGVLKDAKTREEALRSQTEDLRQQLSAAIMKRRVRQAPTQDDLEGEAEKALKAGRPTRDEYEKSLALDRLVQQRSPPPQGHPRVPGAVEGPVPDDYHFKRYYSAGGVRGSGGGGGVRGGAKTARGAGVGTASRRGLAGSVPRMPADAAVPAAAADIFTPQPPREPPRPHSAAAHSETGYADRMIISPTRPAPPAQVRAHGARAVSFSHPRRPMGAYH